MYKCIYLAFIFCGSLVLIGQSQGQVNKDSNLKQEQSPSHQEQIKPEGTESNSNEGKNDILNYSSILTKIETAIRELAPKINKDRVQQQDARELANLQAQMDMARWTERMFFATLFGVGLIAITLYYTRSAAKFASDTLTEAQKATIAAQETVQEAQNTTQAALAGNQISRDIFAATERPWINIQTVPGGPLSYNVNGAEFLFNFIIANIGRSPALDLSVHTKLLVKEIGVEQMNVREEEDKFRNEVSNTPFYPLSDTVFPGQKIAQNIFNTIGIEELKRITKQVDFIMPSVIVAVNYKSSFDTKLHQTGFSFEIRRKDTQREVSIAKNRSQTVIFVDEGDIPAEELQFVRSPLGRSYAD